LWASLFLSSSPVLILFQTLLWTRHCWTGLLLYSLFFFSTSIWTFLPFFHLFSSPIVCQNSFLLLFLEVCRPFCEHLTGNCLFRFVFLIPFSQIPSPRLFTGLCFFLSLLCNLFSHFFIYGFFLISHPPFRPFYAFCGFGPCTFWYWRKFLGQPLPWPLTVEVLYSTFLCWIIHSLYTFPPLLFDSSVLCFFFFSGPSFFFSFRPLSPQ